jgi:hypothetical protein
MEKIKKYIAVFLLAVSTLFIVPHELLHLFTHHHDTSDVLTHPSEGKAFSDKHQHCDVLQLVSPSLYHTLHHCTFVLQNLSFFYADFCFSNFQLTCESNLFLRGPPSII